MREAYFVEQNKEKWSGIETNLKNKKSVHPDVLAEDYLQLTNDLAYAQTFYPESKTREYLNELAIYAHQSIYRDEKSSKNKFIKFFTFDVPKAVYQMRRHLLYSFLIFLLATVIGFVSAHYDLTFVRLILGNAYVDETIHNISIGDPAAIYKSGDALGTSLIITINNIRVAFMAFALGIFFSVGTGYILFTNGIMLGAFHYMFYKYDVLGEAMSAIWIHGAFEISVIVIAGGCGIAMGNSILFPGTYKRIDSFKKEVKKAALILVSTLPFFVIAGFFEGYVTRHYQFSTTISLVIIFICLAIIVFYYILFPINQSQKHLWTD